MAKLLAGANVAIFAGLAVLALCNWFTCRRQGWCWLKLAQCLMGLYWSGLYVFVLLTPPGVYDPVWFGNVFVRPAFTLTGGIMLSAAVVGLRRDSNTICVWLSNLLGNKKRGC